MHGFFDNFLVRRDEIFFNSVDGRKNCRRAAEGLFSAEVGAPNDYRAASVGP